MEKCGGEEKGMNERVNCNRLPGENQTRERVNDGVRDALGVGTMNESKSKSSPCDLSNEVR